MNVNALTRLAEQLAGGQLSVTDFVARLASGPTADVGDAQVDLDRRRRCGFPEVVYGPGKTVPAMEAIFGALLASGAEVLATRVSPEQAAGLDALFPAGRYNAVGRTYRVLATCTAHEAAADVGHVAIVTAGTSDLPVAEEARETALWMGARVTLIRDVGVAGPHRFPARLPEIADADAVVVIAGMEGALPSVVGGYVDCPVIAVPTSVGYGASLGGLAALLGMLNSCASNVTVVNIDAGFKGAYVAALIARNVERKRGSA
jgi:hypothetical protein